MTEEGLRLGDEGLRLEAGPLPLGVHSEVGPLHRVLVHRPDLSLRRLTPANRRELLFDEVLWVARAGEDHDRFVELLRGRGVEVLYLRELLEQVVTHPEARRWIVDRRVGRLRQGDVAPDLREALLEMDPATLVRHLVGGMTLGELPFRPRGLLAASRPDTHFVLPPLPNHLFTRDTSAWVYDGLLVSHMARPARSQEVVHLRAIYRFHPLFRGVDFPVWGGDEDMDYTPASLEGGDVLVLGGGAILIGMGERTAPQAVEMLARRLFDAGAARRVLAVTLPHLRQYMHLDTVMTMIDRDAFCIFPGISRTMRTWSLRPDEGGGLRVDVEPDLFEALADGLGVERVRVLTAGGDEYQAEREQWDDGNNVLAVAPGTVIGYDRNVDTNRTLEGAVIEVLTVPGSELGRGRGGARCMSCPLWRGPA
ncbi:MAG TPA: arginine deiminase [Longimicrobiales bacterium]|nr:arginine deiminase [Longimicrobiales bacterium]